MCIMLMMPHQTLVLLLTSTAHYIREVHQSASNVVTLGLLMGSLVLNLKTRTH